MAQTWHQVRPGEVRHDCGGCHAHSQQPTLFEKTAAAKDDYQVFDLTRKTPLLTTKAKDESKKKWDNSDSTGLAFADGVKDVEFWRDVRPILERSCVACHTQKAEKPSGGLVLDDDRPVASKHHMGPRNAPASYLTLAASEGHGIMGSRYVRQFQSRGSPLIWKVFGKRMDGQSNEDIAPPKKGEKKIEPLFEGSMMPPPEAVKAGKVKALSDEDRLTLIRWIDLGCPIDLTHEPGKKTGSEGWFADRTLPTLMVAYPKAGENRELSRIVIGMDDRYAGLDRESFRVVAEFAIDGVEAGKDVASKFTAKGDGVWELKLAKPVEGLSKGKLTVSVKDRQGNLARIERTFSVSTRKGGR
jgi:hypothetical protein